MNQDLKKKLCTNPNFDHEEETLATQLKKICDKEGKEIEPVKSAPIFHELAKLYLERNSEIVTDRMICLVKSAALFNAAIARSPKNVQEIEKDLKDFYLKI